jgi:hypothetical protein
MVKRWLTLVSLFLACAVGSAAVRAVYRVDLRNGTHVLSLDKPVWQGSVVLFHLYPGGVLTSLPQEKVASVQTEAESLGLRALQPGEVVDVGVTSGHPAAVSASATPAAAPAPIPGGVYDPRNPYYGYGGTYLQGGIPPGDLARAAEAEPPTAENPIAPNGFPAAPGVSPPVIGSNGYPILAPQGAPGSTPPAIGPNGYPILAPPGSPGSMPPVVGNNGYPVLARPGSPGSTQTPIGTNGYPIR